MAWFLRVGDSEVDGCTFRIKQVWEETCVPAIQGRLGELYPRKEQSRLDFDGAGDDSVGDPQPLATALEVEDHLEVLARVDLTDEDGQAA